MKNSSVLKFTEESHIRLMGTVGPRMYSSFLTQLKEVMKKDEGTIRILINSEGGCAGTCLSLAYIIRDLKKQGRKIHTFASCDAQSAGFRLWMLGDLRSADLNIDLMHHQVWTTSFSATEQELDETKNSVKRTNIMLDKLIPIKLNTEEKKKYNAGDDVKWTYREAKKRGFINC